MKTLISVVKRKPIGDSGSCYSILHPHINGYHFEYSSRASFYVNGNNLGYREGWDLSLLIGNVTKKHSRSRRISFLSP